MDQNCSKLQDEVSVFQERVSRVKALQQEVKIHDSLSSLPVKIPKLESFIEVEKKYQSEISTTTTEAKSHADKALKVFQEEKNYRAKDQKVHDDRVVELRSKVDESLTNVYMDFDQVVDPVERLRHMHLSFLLGA